MVEKTLREQYEKKSTEEFSPEFLAQEDGLTLKELNGFEEQW